MVDVGGGTGTTARNICDAFPKLKCVVLDLPHVVANLTETNNVGFVGGDMFKSIPQADAVLLKVQIYLNVLCHHLILIHFVTPFFGEFFYTPLFIFIDRD